VSLAAAAGCCSFWGDGDLRGEVLSGDALDMGV
jgi:hypothetical protein